MSVDNDVIERESIVATLEFDPIDGGTGKASRFGVGEHRKEVVSANLPLEASARWTRRSWARTAQAFPAHSINAAYYVDG